ncbi:MULTISPECIES: cation-translocating P-type ATPase [Methanoculleus]|uniref:P-type Cu(+) transporter n=2 Tax=Methanoculleus TaxID=45989 RepID=A3CXF4_METMJ|nr:MULTISPECIES: HAD-IC family P-type ATPase [Methanoculleus]ABN58054.1 ATPase, P-type (transporting), HAD superfamily, subfamily IC [Methanoculleus marisnigri JR1]MCC7554720.1 HAD-IC family P-type ATPase [Methanoculleus marisnigri]UYU19438.1 HAD-IC family P-type ATPase [Methanoculleus submarinus]
MPVPTGESAGGRPLPDWHALSAEEVRREVGTDPAGLSTGEAEERLQRYGKNVLREEARETRLQVFLRQFKSILIVILIIAAAVSFLVGEALDAAAILIIVVLNAILGYSQEWQAGEAIEALKKMLVQHAVVVRDGERREIDAAGIVPGDVVLLEMGERVPADIYIADATSLEVDEAPLTGESSPVDKAPGPLPAGTALAERSNMAFAGTTVTNGRGRGVAVATGMQTEFGRIAGLSQRVADETTPLARQMDRLGRDLGLIALGIAVLVVAVGLLQQRGLLEMFLVGVSLAVAVIPEGLPAVVTLTLAIGIKTMMRRNCLIRHLPASETLGAVSVICTDKTGTLTRNEMTVVRVRTPDTEVAVTGAGYLPMGEFLLEEKPIDPLADPGLRQFLRTVLLCNHATLALEEGGWRILGTPTEGALVVAAEKAGLSRDDVPEAVKEFSFNSTRKRMTIIYPEEGGDVAHVKGAPEVLLARSSRLLRGGSAVPLTDEDRDAILREIEEYASQGLRVLGAACRPLPAGIEWTADTVETDLVFLGFAGIVDPPRPEAAEAIRLCRSAGIDVIMITGDNPLTAYAVARDLGLSSEGAMTGADLEALGDDELEGRLKTTKVLSRVTAEHKLRVIDILSRDREVIAMTGDGVNDAPALKKASIGIAMGIKGTDAAKESSDMVLVDDNFASIVAGVEEGRREYDNIARFTRYLLSSNVGELVAIVGALLLGLPLILIPVQILWINLVTDGLTALALGLEPAERDVMQRRPRDPQESILTRSAYLVILVLGAWLGLLTIYVFMGHYAVDLDRARTMAFTGLIIFELYNVLNFRSFRYPLHRIGFFSNPALLLAILGSLALQALVVYVPIFNVFLGTAPLTLADWGLLALLGLPVLLAGEAYKIFRLRVRGRSPASG